MSQRFSKLFALPENLCCASAPVMIAAGAIQKGNESGRVFGQLKLRNIQDKGIKAVKVSRSPFLYVWPLDSRRRCVMLVLLLGVGGGVFPPHPGPRRLCARRGLCRFMQW